MWPFFCLEQCILIWTNYLSVCDCLLCHYFNQSHSLGMPTTLIFRLNVLMHSKMIGKFFWYLFTFWVIFSSLFGGCCVTFLLMSVFEYINHCSYLWAELHLNVSLTVSKCSVHLNYVVYLSTMYIYCIYYLKVEKYLCRETCVH